MKAPTPSKAGSSNRKPTIADIGRELGLSVSTVSRALHDNTDISAATRVRVIELARKLGYQRNQMAAALRRGLSQQLGVIVPTLQNNFFPVVLHGIEAARKAGYSIVLCQSHDEARQEKLAVDTLLRAQVSGILVSLAYATHRLTHFQRVRQQGIPLVFFDRMPTGLPVDAVVLDDRLGAYQATSHLLACGCQHVAHLAGQQDIAIYQQRYQGYCEALLAHGLPVREELGVYADLRQGAGQRAARQLLSLPERPDAVFSASDSALAEVLQEVKLQHLRVPQDVALAGFSNEQFTATTEPPLTTVDQRREEMGAAAVRRCLQLLTGATGPAAVQQVVLAPELIVRASSLR